MPNKIREADLFNSMKVMKNNKTPGKDGLNELKTVMN